MAVTVSELHVRMGPGYALPSCRASLEGNLCMWAEKELWYSPIGLLIWLGGPAPWSLLGSPSACSWSSAVVNTLGPVHHIEIAALWISLFTWGLNRCSLASSFGLFGASCCPPVSPATKVNTGSLKMHCCLVAAQVHGFPCETQSKQIGFKTNLS